MEYQDGRYVLTNPITDANIKAMRNNMDSSDLEGFDNFLDRNWGIKPSNGFEDDTVTVNAQAEPKKRGRKPKLQ